MGSGVLHPDDGLSVRLQAAERTTRETVEGSYGTDGYGRGSLGT